MRKIEELNIYTMTANQLNNCYDELFIEKATGRINKCIIINVDGFKYEVILDYLGKYVVYINNNYGVLTKYINDKEFTTMRKLIAHIHKEHKRIKKELLQLSNSIVIEK